MTERRSFRYEFDDEGPRTFTFEYEGEYEQRLECIVEEGVPVLYVNKQACALLARIFAKLALGAYPAGFHLHVERDFNADRPEAMRLVLMADDDARKDPGSS